jgi:hypothetical protein
MEYSSEYTTKAETKEWRKLFRDNLTAVTEGMRKTGIAFAWSLVGSSKRNLVIRHHNKGFDLDYQLELLKNGQNLKAKEIKDAFLDEFKKAWKDTDFSPSEDSTSAITMKLKDVSKSKILVGYDVVIIQKKDGDTEILHHEKGENESYCFQTLPKSKLMPEKIKFIKENKLWRELRDEYYHQKTTDNTDKKSYQLYVETVNIINDRYSPGL